MNECAFVRLCVVILNVRLTWEYDRCRTHWVAAPVVAGCLPALACPVFATVTVSACWYVCLDVGSVPWPKSPGRTLWRGWHKRTPRFHSEWNTVLFSVPPLTDTSIKHA